MNNIIVNSVKNLLTTNTTSQEINDFLNFYDELRFESEVEKLYKKLNDWLFEKYEIENFKIDIISLEENIKERVYSMPSSINFLNPNELLKEYKIELNSRVIIAYSFICIDKFQYIEINEKNEFIKSLFYMITPIISSLSYDEMLKDMSFKDSITDTYNRKFLSEHLNKFLPLARREKKNIAFLMVGIDHYKAVIDEFDYDVGEKLLKHLADVLKSSVRESDIVVRIDVDQFLVTLAGVTNKSDSTLVAQKLIDNFANSVIRVNDSGQTLKKTICVGITYYDFENGAVDEILRNADISLYEARNMGRGVYKEYIKAEEENVELF